MPAALEIAQRIESGICHVNDTTVQDEPQMPFGGVKSSGFGRFGGRAALEEFTELRWITVQDAAEALSDLGRRVSGAGCRGLSRTRHPAPDTRSFLNV